MRDEVEGRLADLGRRAGLVGVPPVVVAAASVVLAIAVALSLWRWWPREAAAFESGPRAVPSAERTAAGGSGPEPGESGGGARSAEATSPGGVVTVHVVGAVVRPGVYRLPASARVCDAVASAGGLTGNAAQLGVNLARPLTDGEQIAVPTLDELSRGAGGGASGGGPAQATESGRGGAPGTGTGAPGALININTADAAALDTLPGVGPSTAAKIVADREANGPFSSPDDLGRIPGIGPKKLEQLKGSICVR